MAETDRSFRKFMTDPKTAVMHYIAENLPSASQTQGQAVGLSNGPTFDHVQFAPQQQPQTTAEISSVNQLGQPFVYTESSQPSNVYHQYTSTHLDPQQGNAPAPGWVSRPSSTPGVAFSQPPPQSQADSITYPQPWMSQHARTNMSSPPPAGTGIPMQPNQPASSNGYYASGLPDQAALQAPNPTQSSEIRETFGMAPPSTPIRQTNKPPAVSRAYHRMILEYEKTKGLFFAASADDNVQLVSQSAYQLECLALQIWSFRREHAFEFEGYSTAEHAAVILEWRTKYSLWADTVLDLQEGITVPNNLPLSGDAQAQNLNTYMSRLHMHSPTPAGNEQDFMQQTNMNGTLGFQGQQDAHKMTMTPPPPAMNAPSMYQNQIAPQIQPVLTPPTVPTSAASQYQQNSQNPPAASHYPQSVQNPPAVPHYQQRVQNPPNLSQSQVGPNIQRRPVPQTHMSGAASQQMGQNVRTAGSSSALPPNASGRPLSRPQSNNSQPGSLPNGVGTRPNVRFATPPPGQNLAVKHGSIMT